MDSTLLTILISVTTAVLGAIAVDLYVHVKNRSKKAIERHKKEKIEEFKSAVAPCVEDALKPIDEKITDLDATLTSVVEKDLPILKRANRDSLRNQLFASYRHCDKVGYRTIEDTENWEFMYSSYLDLGGNSFMPTLHDQFLALPLETLESARYKAKHGESDKQ